MKILHITPTYYSNVSVIGGGEKYVLYMIAACKAIAAFTNRNHQSSILAFGPSEATFMYAEVRHEVLKGGTSNVNELDSISVNRALEPFEVVVVHQCLTTFGLAMASLAKMAGKIVIGMDHGGGEDSMVYGNPLSTCMFDLFVAQSHYAAKAFQPLRTKTKIILGPVNMDLFSAGRHERDPDLIVSVGRIFPHKGFDRILRALPAGKRLFIAGSASHKQYLQLLILEAKHSRGEVAFFHDLSDGQVREFLMRASLYVHASTHTDCFGTSYLKPELLGLAPLEALACGTPVAVSDAGSLPELSKLEGCSVFRSEVELRDLLSQFGRQRRPHENEIVADVARNYGHLQFGAQLFSEIDRLLASS